MWAFVRFFFSPAFEQEILCDANLLFFIILIIIIIIVTIDVVVDFKIDLKQIYERILVRSKTGSV